MRPSSSRSLTLTAGARLGPYEIVDSLGAGGMGEVYKARDTRLERTVAIKVLPSHFAADQERRARFEVEARAISRLNHPHICMLHDVGHEGGIDFLVMEYLEGETLARRLERGPLPLDQVLRYGIEIADALARAHKQSIIHRDLKPGNVMLTKSGAKLLDFGLAKVHLAVVRASALSQAPTDTRSFTRAGTLLGTVQYMSPEQLEGEPTDERSDIWALGCVLYEMGTGRRAFDGKSRAGLIAAILSSEPPPMSSVQPMIPRALDRLVRTCLAKDADERWQSAQDLVNDLRWLEEAGAQLTRQPPLPARWKRRDQLLAAFVGAVATAMVAGPLVWTARAKPPVPVMRFTVPLTGPPPLVQPALTLSPDGTRLVFAGGSSGTAPLYIRAFDHVETAPIPGTERATGPFFSPDGRWIAFFADRKLRKVNLQGGTPITLCEAANPRGGAWGADDTIVFAPGSDSGLYQVPARGGSPVAVTHIDRARQERSHRWPAFLPDGKAVLFTVESPTRPHGALLDATISVVVLATGERREVLRGGTFPYYVPGFLLFARRGTLVAAPFDLDGLQVKRSPAPVIENVVTYAGSRSALYAASATGTLAYLEGPPVDTGDTVSLVWVDRSGRIQPVGLPPRGYRSPTLSSDGERVVVDITEADGRRDVWVGDLDESTLRRLTFTGEDTETPAWTPDRRHIVYASGPEGPRKAILRRPADGSGAEETLLTGRHLHVNSISPDGRWLVYSDFGPQGEDAGDLGVLALGAKEGKAEPRPLFQGPFGERAARFSPDGRWLAYTSNESGRDEVYVQAFPGPGGKWQVSAEGGAQPVWARSGRELFYRSGDKLLAVPTTMGATFSARAPRVLFALPLDQGNPLRGDPAYDVSLDGQRFLMVKQADPGLAGGGGQINVVVNWSTELARRIGPSARP
jgi:serine/threonine protein kinase/Tol biopolymer transport system component